MSSFYRQHGKRWLDLCVAWPLLVLLSPVLLGIALVVRAKLGAPVLFTQKRPGLHGKPFTIYKFRTMRDARDEAGKPLSDAERLTPFGRFLRATSLDELPELWNVARGNMSLVGPRPLLPDYLERYSPRQARRHETRPGLTGLAQVSGRNRLPWSAKFALDTLYVDRCSLKLDAWILFRTVLTVFAREGISAEGYATAPTFTPRPASLLPSGVDATTANVYKSPLPSTSEYKEVFPMESHALLQTLDEAFERTPGTTRMDEVLEGIAEYSSMTFLVLIATIDEEFGVTIAPEEFRSCHTVADLAARVDAGATALKRSA